MNIYTGPIYVATLANLASLILIVVFFKDKPTIHQPVPQNEYKCSSKSDIAQKVVQRFSTSCPDVNFKCSLVEASRRRSSQAVAALTTDMRAFDLSLALSCILVRMVATLTITTIQT
ncbi:unnamed protein product [Gongylonema pulchrum]|uniref:Uncharacterized protein n=1 Tax=Gongylonema pulchrum TaxID=637853 RepID=A0A3P7RI14_9BILA|nr:unnamed protein product [Gongylonema pulchrum]